MQSAQGNDLPASTLIAKTSVWSVAAFCNRGRVPSPLPG